MERFRKILITDLSESERDKIESFDYNRSKEIILPDSFLYSHKKEDFTACQHNILILLFEALQPYMREDEPAKVDLDQSCKVLINTFEIMSSHLFASYVCRSAIDLLDLPFGFPLINAKTGRTEIVWESIITMVEEVCYTSFLRLTVNSKFFPVLTYSEKWRGGTRLSKEQILRTKDNHTKIILELLLHHHNYSRFPINSFDLWPDDLRNILGLPEYLRLDEIVFNVVEPARRWFKSFDSIAFDYEFVEKNPGSRKEKKIITRRRKERYLSVAIYENTPEQEEESMASRWLKRILNDPSMVEYAKDAIVKSGKMPFFESKCSYFHSLLDSGEMTQAHVDNTLKKILREKLDFQMP